MTPLSTTDQALGDALLAAGKINRSQLRYAQLRQGVGGGGFAGHLLRLGLVGAQDLAVHLAAVRGLPYLVGPSPRYADDAVAMCRRDACLSLGFLPLSVSGGVLEAWIGEVEPEKVAEWAHRRLGMELRAIQGPFDAVNAAVHAAYSTQRDNNRDTFERERRRLAQDTQGSLGTEPLMQALVALAGRERATDIHLTPDQQALTLAFRVDGVLTPVAALPRGLMRLISAIKVAAGMDIADTLRPQDGRFSFDGGGFQFDIRVSTTVTPHGEAVVMRLLSKGNAVSGLEELGFYAEHLPMLRRFFEQPYGIVLMTGPTGSGKTTTLYAGIKPHGMSGKSILTVEDPVEYDLPSACQTQVNRKAGYTFDAAIRHFLRHDPDIMLVGEIRDVETAEAAMRASETGHLVLSTLHVNNVFGVPSRLESLGVARGSFSEALVGVVTQRLVRRLCSACREEDAALPENASTALRQRIGEATLYRAVGCAECNGTGYRGRLPAYEILCNDAAVSRWVASGGGRHALEGVLHAGNHVTMLDVCARRLRDGETSFEEYRRVFGVFDEMAPGDGR